MLYFTSFLLTFLICLFLIKKPLVKSIPTDRGLHQFETASSGGLAILIGFSISLIIGSEKLPLLLAILIPITIIGIIDDIYHTSKFIRFGAQIIFSFAALYLMNGMSLDYLTIFIIIFLMTYFINAYNFMDGIDSLVTFQTLFILLCFILLIEINPLWNNIIIIMISSLFGFLIFNLSPAKLFLGNSGSYLLGMYISILILGLYYMFDLNIFTILIICTIIIVDTVYVILKRYSDKFLTHYSKSTSLSSSLITSIKYVTEAHCTHNYQQLTKKYKSHNKVVLLIMMYNILWCLPLSKISMIYYETGALWLLLSYTPYIIWCYSNKAGIDIK
tara:strand:- start:142 stop:1134 length:993 start_codon:yes stop_codon:yes gene_type:complete